MGNGVAGSVFARPIDSSSALWRFGLAQQTTGGRVEVRSGNSQRLNPGTYDEVVVRGNATLTFASGSYTIRSVIFESNAKLQAPLTGVAEVGIKQTFQWRGSVVTPDRSASHLLWVYNGQDELHFDSGLSGTVVAPRVKANLKRGTHFGAVFAKSVETHADAILNHKPLNWSGKATQRATPKAYVLSNAQSVATSTGVSRSNLLPTLLGVTEGDLIATVRTSQGIVPYSRITGLGTLAGASCTRGFTLDVTTDGAVTLSPPDACDGKRFEVTPLAKFVPANVSVWERILPSNRVAFVPSGPNGSYTRTALTTSTEWVETWTRNVTKVLSSGLLMTPRKGRPFGTVHAERRLPSRCGSTMVGPRQIFTLG